MTVVVWCSLQKEALGVVGLPLLRQSLPMVQLPPMLNN